MPPVMTLLQPYFSNRRHLFSSRSERENQRPAGKTHFPFCFLIIKRESPFCYLSFPNRIFRILLFIELKVITISDVENTLSTNISLVIVLTCRLFYQNKLEILSSRDYKRVMPHWRSFFGISDGVSMYTNTKMNACHVMGNIYIYF